MTISQKIIEKIINQKEIRYLHYLRNQKRFKKFYLHFFISYIILKKEGISMKKIANKEKLNISFKNSFPISICYLFSNLSIKY